MKLTTHVYTLHVTVAAAATRSSWQLEAAHRAKTSPSHTLPQSPEGGRGEVGQLAVPGARHPGE